MNQKIQRKTYKKLFRLLQVYVNYSRMFWTQSLVQIFIWEISLLFTIRREKMKFFDVWNKIIVHLYCKKRFKCTYVVIRSERFNFFFTTIIKNSMHVLNLVRIIMVNCMQMKISSTKMAKISEISAESHLYNFVSVFIVFRWICASKKKCNFWGD